MSNLGEIYESRLLTFYSKLVHSIWYFCFKGSTDTRCETGKVPLAIKQFFIEYNIEETDLGSNRLFYMIPTQSRFIQDLIIYNGALSSASCDKESFGKSGTIVTQLLKSYLHKDHTLYVDNWYTNPAVFIFLHKNGTNAYETVKKRRKSMPIIQNELKTGETSFSSSNLLLSIK
ncbi:hypothetical protein HZH68_011634 [Vespula germanica]|uniref:PiggyBac transposable element-derived protein domain-containing protein n=1 Tax=Vespula germanica TaxID=30212 RepID=A0A834MYH3_VESGE|nr:hypothetical protein HZH68_011634 [Vespula germanica]